MKKNSFLNDILQNTSCPQGFWGRMILRGMNCFHASLARRGMKQVDWRPEWNVLDIGCGGGANVKRLLKLCPQGKVYGMDLSEESVAFARRHNAGELDRRCFIQQGDVCSLPYGDGAFDAVTAFETVYFWSSVSKALAAVWQRHDQSGLAHAFFHLGLRHAGLLPLGHHTTRQTQRQQTGSQQCLQARQ